MRFNIITLFLLLASGISHAQISTIRNFDLELVEKDSIKTANLQQSINGFLSEALKNEYTSKYVDTAHVKKYNFFFQKLAGIGYSNERFKFNPPSILKSYSEDGETYRIAVAFTGIRDSVPFVYQITELIAVPFENHYRFYCPFEENTKNFHQKDVKTVTYYYSGDFNQINAQTFADFKEDLSKWTKTSNDHLDYYCFQSLDELLKAYGFLYSARQCNFLCFDLGFADNEGKSYITGTRNENYVSEYVENYLYHTSTNQDSIYWPFLTGLSMNYGGYGLSLIPLSELKKELAEALKTNPDINFLEEFKKGRKASINRHFTHYVISAILSHEIISKHGFSAALTTIHSGPNGEKFYQNLNKILQINEQNFHESIVDLIHENN